MSETEWMIADKFGLQFAMRGAPWSWIESPSSYGGTSVFLVRNSKGVSIARYFTREFAESHANSLNDQAATFIMLKL
jgi:hypothetical protein